MLPMIYADDHNLCSPIIFVLFCIAPQNLSVYVFFLVNVVVVVVFEIALVVVYFHFLASPFFCDGSGFVHCAYSKNGNYSVDKVQICFYLKKKKTKFHNIGKLERWI